MKQFSNWEKAKESAKFEAGEKLPVGGYVCKIKAVAYTNPQNGNSGRIDVQFDIVEGEYKDFFQKQYDGNTSDDKKWKGRTTIWEPMDDGSEKDEWTKNTFAKWTNAFEESNPGYVWDWDESKWKDKLVGILYGEVGTVIDGKEIVYTEARFPTSVNAVRENKFKIPKFKSKNGYTGSRNTTSGSGDEFINADPMDLPFT